MKQIATSAKKVSDDSGLAREYAYQGEKTLQGLVAEMDRITNTVNSAEAVIRDLGDQSEAIMEIITIIRDINGQTNLLALNAAIEAARAGEQARFRS